MASELKQQKFNYLFGIFDKSGGGTLTEADFKDMFGGVILYEEEAKTAAKAARRWWLLLSLFADKNNDKRVSQTEWAAWLNGMAIEADKEEGGSKTFQRWADATFDTFANSDGEVTAGDYRRWFTAFGLSGDADEAFQKLDVNGSEIVNREEFSQRLKEFVQADDADAAGNYLWGNPF